MKISPILFRQHIGWHFDKHWVFQGKRKPIKTNADKVLKERGIQVCQPDDILKEKIPFERVNVIGYIEPPVVFDKTHPDWHDQTLLTYRDENVLIEGLNQAKVITNTVELKDGLPDHIKFPSVAKNIDKMVQKIILTSNVFDLEQKKLPKIKDPERPAWNFPRSFGITQNRKIMLMTSKLLQLIESTSSQQLTEKRYLFRDLLFSFPFEIKDQLTQFQLSGDFVLTSSSPLPPVTNESTESQQLPDIFPLEPIISLNTENIYKIEKIYPINSGIAKSHPHTLFVHYNKEEVKNLFEEEVTETQIFGRSLLKAFTVAASYARRQYGDEVKTLPKPVSLQCIQTDGQFYHFGVFQLNTLDLIDPLTKNIWYQTPLQNLFESCKYELGKPVLKGYNEEIIKQLYGFYNVY